MSRRLSNSPCTEAKQSPQVMLQLKSNPLYLSGARELVSAVARRLGFADEDCGKLALAVDEALCNVIRHGYGRDSNRPIWVSLFPVEDSSSSACCGGATVTSGTGGCDPGMNCHPGALKIVIEDEARQIDPTEIRSRNLEEVRPGGLGVHIIKAVMDEVTYEKRPEGGMRLTMIKKRMDRGEKSSHQALQASGATQPGAGGGAVAGSQRSNTDGGRSHG